MNETAPSQSANESLGNKEISTEIAIGNVEAALTKVHDSLNAALAAGAEAGRDIIASAKEHLEAASKDIAQLEAAEKARAAGREAIIASTRSGLAELMASMAR